METDTRLNAYISALDISERFPKRKSKTYLIHQTNTIIVLGHVKWFPRWRQYCFFPFENTVFNSLCLSSIRTLCETLTIKK